MVGLGNVDDTSDAQKPISSATQSALDAKAPLANPTFTGNVSIGNSIISNKFIPQWNIVGEDIYGESGGDESGTSVSLSSDGTVVAIGAPDNDGNGNLSGHVRVYKYNPTKTVAITDQNASNFGPVGWDRLGQDIDGEAGGDFSGRSVSLSSDGKIVAIGAKNNSNGDVSQSGHVRVYKLNESTTPSTWQQLGQDIDGEEGGNYSGTSVSLSSDGKIVAIGAPFNYNNVNDETSGHVRVYKLNESTSTPTWQQLGQDIDGEAEYDFSGYSVSLSSNGKIVAIGANGNDGNGANSGHVRVYKLNESTSTPSWQQLGQDIDGEAEYNDSGRSVSLSEDGTIVAIGAIYNNGNGIHSGHVRVYKLNESTTPSMWEQLGQDIDGEAVSDNSGCSVSLSSDGTILAIGANGNDGSNTNTANDNRGHVRVYKLNESTTTPSWEQFGQDIDGEAGGDYSGTSVSLSSDGTILAIGAIYGSDGYGNYSGYVRVYKLDTIEDGINIPKCTFTESVSGLEKVFILNNYDNDEKAKNAGIPLYGLYRTGDVIKMRVI